MTFGQSIKQVFRNLTNFQGRARRSEFWWFYLFMTIVSFPLSFLIMIPMFGALVTLDPNADGTMSDADAGRFVGAMFATFALAAVLSIVSFILILAVWVRRLHDAGYSGHWLWLSLAGLSIVPLIFAILEGQRGPNRWGEDPKGIENGQWPTLQQTSPTYAQPTYVPPPLDPGPNVVQPPASGEPTDPFANPPR